MIHTTYGEGGYDETKPNNNIIEQYDDGVVDENVEQKTIPVTAIAELQTKLDDPTVNSIAEVKSALSDFIGQII